MNDDEKIKSKTWDFAKYFLGESWENQIKIFHLAEKFGIHITKPGFYSPIPTVGDLTDEMFEAKDNLHLDWNKENQLILLKELKKYSSEYGDLTKVKKYDSQNGAFEYHDAPIYYSIIRHFKPSKIIEVGAGNSTKLAYLASEKNEKIEITSIDPYIPKEIEKKFSKDIRIFKKPVQKIDISLFQELEKNDILFIDNSHVSKIGSDVNFLILEILPTLKSGVIVHIHDIFLPKVYPRKWLDDNNIFWNEQFLLHAFLINNNNFEIILANHYLHVNFPEKLIEFYDTKQIPGGGSFWIRRK